MDRLTENQANEIYTESIGENNLVRNLKIYLINPLSIGLAGFAAFFGLIIFTNFFSYLFGMNETFSLEINDVILSLTGFVFAAGAKFLEFFSKEEN
ncbi:MAG: hypothetical protein IPM32_05555 [Ignavibacteriae bacterium]|nr:hypothetical protein [Ignavibacteriota bacterium]